MASISSKHKKIYPSMEKLNEELHNDALWDDESDLSESEDDESECNDNSTNPPRIDGMCYRPILLPADHE